MSVPADSQDAAAGGTTEPGWRQRIREVGKAAFIREEMERLGFWPPVEGRSEAALEAEKQLKILYKELRTARQDLREVQEDLSKGGDVTRLILQIRKQRIERVRAAREARRVEREAQQEERRLQDREWRQKTLPYLGRGVSGGLRYEGGDGARLQALGLPAVNTALDLAAAMGISSRELGWLTYHRGAASIDHYHRFTIPKRTGGMRVISAPKRQLRAAQRWVLENILSKIPVHDAAMAFLPGRSIVQNAAIHSSRAIVFRLDLKDFFPSISFRRVKGLFESFGYNEGIATIQALLCTEAPRASVTLDGVKRFVSIGERQLPQGACTSPALTNVLCRKMDSRLAGAARSFGFAYSRYADDLVFSHPDGIEHAGEFLNLVRVIIMNEGFILNEKKTQGMRPQHRQMVTGIVVNEGTRVSRRDVRRFRAFLHQCERDGLEEMSKRIGQNAHAYASGYLSFIHMVNPEQEAKIKDSHPWLARW